MGEFGCISFKVGVLDAYFSAIRKFDETRTNDWVIKLGDKSGCDEPKHPVQQIGNLSDDPAGKVWCCQKEQAQAQALICHS